MLFEKVSGRTFKRFGTIIRGRNRNSLKVKSCDTHPFLIKSPSEALEKSIFMAAFCNRHVDSARISGLIFSRSMITFGLRLFEETKTMAQRRAEKPKKVKISPKQQEFYSRLKLFKR